MKLVRMIIAVLGFALSAFAQAPPNPVTVPITLDHNRIVIDVYLPLPDGTRKRVRAWVETGNGHDDEPTHRLAVWIRKQRWAGLQGNSSA